MSVLKIRDENEQWTSIPTIKGDAGDAAGFGTVTATVDANHGTPSVTVTTSGEDTAKNFAFEFSNLQPAPYDDSELQTDFATLQAQFDTAVAAVTVDSEVADVRVGADGTIYNSAGAAVRSQVSDLKQEINHSVELLNNKNVANPNDKDYLAGAYLDTSGVEHATVYYNATGFVPVEVGQKYVASYDVNGTRTACKMRFVTAYDSSKTAIPSKGLSSESLSYSVPDGVSFVRFSVSASYWDDLQIEFGIGQTDYVTPNVTRTPIRIADNSIQPQALQGWKVTNGYNIVPTGIGGSGAWYVSGSEIAYMPASGSYANFKYYIIEIESNTRYIFNHPARWIVTADINGTPIVYDPNGRRYVDSGANAKYLIVTYDSVTYSDGFVVCKGEDINETTKYTADWFMPNLENVKGTAIANRAYCSMPDTIYMNTSESIKIYLDDILSQKGSYFWCNNVSDLTTFINDEYLQITCSTAGSYSLKWEIYDSNLQRLDSGTTTVKVSLLSSLANATALVLGDSFVAYGYLSSALADVFAEQGKTLTLIGTRGTSPNLHEGRGGWSADVYCNYASAGAFTNPFYHNSTFDFAYYMSQNGYSHVDYVFINLGINKIFGQTFASYAEDIPKELEYYMDIIESIHDYDSNIKIFCNLPTPPNTQDGKFSQAYGTQQMLWLYANNIKRYAKDMIDNIAGTNVYIVGTNFVFDTESDIADGVHPAVAGYPILAKTMVNAVIGA